MLPAGPPIERESAVGASPIKGGGPSAYGTWEKRKDQALLVRAAPFYAPRSQRSSMRGSTSLQPPLSQSLQARLDEMELEMNESLRAKTPKPAAPTSPEAETPSPPRSRSRASGGRCPEQRPLNSPVRVTVADRKVTYYPPKPAASSSTAGGAPGDESAQQKHQVESQSAVHESPHPSQNGLSPLVPLPLLPQEGQQGPMTPWELRKNSTILQLERRLATKEGPQSPLRGIENLLGRTPGSLAPGATPPPPSSAAAAAAAAAALPPQGVLRAPPGELLLEEPLLGVAPQDFVRPGAIRASPLPKSYAPGAGFEPEKHMDAAACRFPPTLSHQEREAARAAERARARPQAWERDRSAALLKLEGDREKMEAAVEAARRREAEAKLEADAREAKAEEKAEAAAAQVRPLREALCFPGRHSPVVPGPSHVLPPPQWKGKGGDPPFPPSTLPNNEKPLISRRLKESAVASVA